LANGVGTDEYKTALESVPLCNCLACVSRSPSAVEGAVQDTCTSDIKETSQDCRAAAVSVPVPVVVGPSSV
jgi:hypothetical protein